MTNEPVDRRDFDEVHDGVELSPDTLEPAERTYTGPGFAAGATASTASTTTAPDDEPELDDEAQSAEEPARPPKKRLTRSRRDVVIGGVAGGFAEYVDADPTLVRLAFIVLIFITAGAFLLVYFGALIVMPEGDDTAPEAPPARRRGASIGHGLFWGGVLILLGGLLLLRQLDIDLPRWEVLLAGALIVVGLLIVVESRRGLNSGLTVLAVILTALMGLSTFMNITVQGAFGEQTVQVQSINDLDSSYGHAFGSMTLDLRNVEFPDGETRVKASVVFGNLEVLVPDHVGVRGSATSLFGRTQVAQEAQAGFSLDWTYESPNYAGTSQRVELELTTLFGSTRVIGGR